MTEPPRTIWAYSYQLVPPQPADRLKRLKAMLDKEHIAARQRQGTWEGRLVADERIADILVLSDSPDLDLEVNRRIEATLKALDVDFALTVPMAVADDGPGDAAPKD